MRYAKAHKMCRPGDLLVRLCCRSDSVLATSTGPRVVRSVEVELQHVYQMEVMRRCPHGHNLSSHALHYSKHGIQKSIPQAARYDKHAVDWLALLLHPLREGGPGFDCLSN
jgi:hypothetical protein